MITLEYKDYFIVDIYVPNLNPHSPPDRLDFRIEWDKAVWEYVTKLPKPVIMCGDFNVARKYIDIYPENQKNTPSSSFENMGFNRLWQSLINIESPLKRTLSAFPPLRISPSNKLRRS